MRVLIIFTALIVSQALFAQNQDKQQPSTATSAAAGDAKATGSSATGADPAKTEIANAEYHEVKATIEPINTGLFINPTLTLASRDLSQSGSQVGKMTASVLETKVGYVFNFGLFAGAQGSFSIGTAKGSTASDIDTTTYFAGPMVGYSDKWTGLFVTATYHVVGKSNMSSAGDYSKVNGFQFDLGYPMKISENVKFGPQLSWKGMKYSDGSSGLADVKTKELTPYFGLWLYF